MRFSNLHIVHLYDYQKPEEGQCPLELFVKSVNPVALSTCMRHIYIFTSAQLTGKEQVFDNVITQIQTPQPHKKTAFCEYLQGEQAYQFLLFWSIGGLNKNKLFADERILGDLRKSCTQYEKSNSTKKQKAWKENKTVMLALEMDSKNLLPLTKKNTIKIC